MSELKRLIREHINKIDKLKINETNKSSGMFFEKEEGENNHDFVRRVFLSEKFINKKDFDVLYDQAIGGSGDENVNMNNVISSALFPFLFFSMVSENNPITIKNGDIINTYTQVCFEFKNRTLSGNSDFAPSNVDIVLTNKDFTSIMFIESKFSEYILLRKTEYFGLSTKYKNEIPTNHIIAKLIENKIIFYKDGKMVFKDDQNKDHRRYYEGIKQMITHISGIYNFIMKKYCSNNDVHSYDAIKSEIRKAQEKNIIKTFYLQEIVFDFEKYSVKAEALEDYKDLHKSLIKSVESVDLKGLKVLPLLTYNEIVKENNKYVSKLPEIIRDLYLLDH